MKHVDDGTLRRLIDEPFAVSTEDRTHAAACPVCEERLGVLRGDMAFVSAAIQAPTTNVTTARQQVHAAIAGGNTATKSGAPRWPRLSPATRRGAIGVGIAAIVSAAVVLTPAGSLGKDFLSIFQPQQFAAIPITAGELRTLPDLRGYGTLRTPAGSESRHYTAVTSAETEAGVHISLPGALPAGIPSETRFTVVPGSTSSFTFSKAQATLSHPGATAMPAAVDGSTLALSTSPAVVTMYGPRQEIPSLVVAQTIAPRIHSNGAGLAEIEKYVLHLPGVSSKLAAEIQAISNPASTLPIPIPENWAVAQKTTVNGHQGLIIGDNTGVASGVIWRDGDMIYGVAGSLTESQVLDIASSLR